MRDVIQSDASLGWHGRTLLRYFRILNSGDQDRWEEAFENTWHPEAIFDGLPLAELRERHRRRLRAGRVVKIHVIRDIDPHQVEYTTEAGGKHDGPFVATFRDGRIYRVL
jgi:hypothetical protein